MFNVADIRAAFEEVRSALNLSRDTVLFGVPVDADDCGLMQNDTNANIVEEKQDFTVVEETTDSIVQKIESENIDVDQEIIDESDAVVVKEKPKKRGRPRKEVVVEESDESENIEETVDDNSESDVVPILSVLSTNPDEEVSESDDNEIIEDSEQETKEDFVDADENVEDIEDAEEEQDIEDAATEEIVSESTKEPAEIEQITDMPDIEIDMSEPINDDDEADLEKLLSAMTPLQEDTKPIETHVESDVDDDAVSVDATLEQLATEFAESQDKIHSENKSSTRSKIGKLRNILPFKQSKHKDQGLGDLFGWAGIAANDEDFSVPGFFTSAASKK